MIRRRAKPITTELAERRTVHVKSLECHAGLFGLSTTLVCLALALNFVTADVARAAQPDSAQDGAAPATLAAALDYNPVQWGRRVPPVAPGVIAPPALWSLATLPHRPAVLVPLYTSFASLQALDIDSTLKTLNHGGVEANPIVRRVIGSPAAAIGLKVAFTAGMIASSEKLWKKNRAAAILMMVATNSAYAVVVTHNYSVAR